MQLRKLGRFDRELSLVGLGGVVLMNRPQDEVDSEVAQAIDSGVNYFDVAPSYGNSQQLLGPALKPYRSKVFLACKTAGRTAHEAGKDIMESLRALQTDHFDLYQMHGLESLEDTRRALGPCGAIQTFLDAKRRGLTKLIGFSAHHEPSAMLAIQSGYFDTMLLPLNYVMYETGRFGRRAIKAAAERGMGILAIKSMARQNVPEGEPRTHSGCWYQPEDNPEVAELMLRWTLSLPGVTAALPPGNPTLFRQAVSFAKNYQPIDEDGLRTLRQRLEHAKPMFSNILATT